MTVGEYFKKDKLHICKIGSVKRERGGGRTELDGFVSFFTSVNTNQDLLLGNEFTYNILVNDQ